MGKKHNKKHVDDTPVPAVPETPADDQNHVASDDGMPVVDDNDDGSVEGENPFST